MKRTMRKGRDHKMAQKRKNEVSKTIKKIITAVLESTLSTGHKAING
jgi:hypothetical protein